MDDQPRGTILHFWRGARQRSRIWWSSLADAPKRPLVTVREVMLFFLIGAAIAVAAYYVATHLQIQ